MPAKAGIQGRGILDSRLRGSDVYEVIRDVKMNILSNDLIWWITAVDLPALGGLLLFIWRTRRDSEEASRRTSELVEARNNQLREGLAAFKLEVAKGYASHNDLKELENRLVSHLLRIEAKLDTTALKAEALSAEKFVYE
jgi:hypothetical protein